MNEAYNIKILQAAGYDIENTVRELGSIDIYNELLNDLVEVFKSSTSKSAIESRDRSVASCVKLTS